MFGHWQAALEPKSHNASSISDRSVNGGMSEYAIYRSEYLGSLAALVLWTVLPADLSSVSPLLLTQDESTGATGHSISNTVQ